MTNPLLGGLPQPTAPMPNGQMPATNPITAELHALSPGAKSALQMAHEHAISQTSMQGTSHPPNNGDVNSVSPPITDPSMHQTAAPIGAAPQNPDPQGSLRPGGTSPAMPALPSAPQHLISPPPGRGTIGGEENNVASLMSHPAGVDSIQNPIGHVAAKIGEGIGGIIAPGLTSRIPGTELHQQRLIQQGQNNVKLLQGNEANDTTDALKQAQTVNAQSMPELHQAQTDLKDRQLKEKTDHDQATVNNSLRRTGNMVDENGNTVPIPYEQLSDKEQGAIDVQKSTEELHSAQSDLARFKANPDSPQAQAALQRVKNAQNNQQLGWAKLGLARDNYMMRSHGTDAQGNALPGAMLTGDENSPTAVGSAFQQNVRPTGAQRAKGTLADSAKKEIGTMMDVATKHPDWFHVGGELSQSFQKALSQQDPDAKRFQTAHAIAGEHAAAMFGSHSAEVIKQIDGALGSFNDNPAAAKAAMDEVLGATKTFKDAGTMRTAGSGGSSHGPSVGAVEGGYRFKGGDPGKQESWEKVQ